MYTQFFGLSEPPFSISPLQDPKSLFMSEQHGEALAHLEYGIQTGASFILLTGEVGTGKTTIARYLLRQLPAQTQPIFVFNPALSGRDLLATICDELKISYHPDAGIKELFDLIRQQLVATHEAGLNGVALIIDEAQLLSADVLELLRLLTNPNATEQALLHIVLIGQPELQLMLRQAALRQVDQRIGARYHLLPLSRDDVDAYVRFRLQLVGCLQPIFSARATQALHQLTGGVPRLINLVCDRALISAYARASQRVDEDDIRRAAFEVSGRQDPGQGKSSLPLLATVAMACAFAAIGWFGWQKFGAPPAPEIIKVPVAVTVDETPLQQKQLSEAIYAALDHDVALANLFEVWGYGVQPDESHCDSAPRAGLRCLEGEASLSELRRWRHPALVSLNDATSGVYYATLVSIKGTQAELMVGAQRWQMTTQWLEDHWAGSYTLFWRPALGEATTIDRSASPALWQWLDDALSRASAQPVRQVSQFDDTLALKLQQFQQAQGLPADGVAGSHTLMRLNALAGEAMPRLEEVAP
ncbi:MAG: ExeA family protein [Aeromonas sp.]